MIQWQNVIHLSLVTFFYLTRLLVKFVRGGKIFSKKFKKIFSSKFDKNGVEDPKKKVSTILGLKVTFLCVFLTSEHDTVKITEISVFLKAILEGFDMPSSEVEKTHKNVVFRPKMVETFFLGSSTPFLSNFEEQNFLNFFEKISPPPPDEFNQKSG